MFRSWVPVFFDVAQKLAVMSIGFLLQNTDDAVVWRGPKKNGSLQSVSCHTLWVDRNINIKFLAELWARWSI